MTIEAAYGAYLASLRQQVRARVTAAHGTARLTSPGMCLQAWPPSLADVHPVGCQLQRGHRSRHLFRPPGGTAAVEWV